MLTKLSYVVAPTRAYMYQHTELLYSVPLRELITCLDTNKHEQLRLATWIAYNQTHAAN